MAAFKQSLNEHVRYNWAAGVIDSCGVFSASRHHIKLMVRARHNGVHGRLYDIFKAGAAGKLAWVVRDGELLNVLQIVAPLLLFRDDEAFRALGRLAGVAHRRAALKAKGGKRV